MTRIATILALLMLHAISAYAQADSGAPPNFILILSDDHRYDFMSFMDEPATPEFLSTPNLDRMATEGAHLRNAFVTTSLCSPSRASILTGQYAHNHGVIDNQRPQSPGTIFFPEYLQEAGYETAFIGKWHMGEVSDDPQPGFDHWVSFRGQGVYFDPLLNVNGEHVEEEGYITDILTGYALEWLRERDDPRPFFLYLSFKAVHHPFRPPPRYEDRYASAEKRYPQSMADTEENYRGKPQWVREARNSFHGVDFTFYGDIPFEEVYQGYTETLLAVDENVGKILDFVDASGIGKETVAFYMGDNGFLLGEHGLIDKRVAYEESIRIPFLAYAPGRIAPGTIVDEMVLNIDVAPTILNGAGIAMPEQMDGHNMLPLLMGEEVVWRDEFLYEYFWERNFPQQPTMFSLRDERYKYIYYHGMWATDELYDIREDPLESTNLMDDPAHEDLVAQMRKRLFRRLRETKGVAIDLAHEPTWWQVIERGSTE